LWVRCDTPGVLLDLRFVDTQTKTRGDHTWRRHWLWEQGPAPDAGPWRHVQIPLAQLAAAGTWEGDRWHEPQGAFDRHAVQRFENAADYHDRYGVNLCFDNVGLTYPSP
jgi:hypothetical protein